MKCSKPFLRSFLSKDLVKKLYRPLQEKLLWEREMLHMPNTQLLVDWEIKTEELKSQLRFGLRPVLPKKPAIVLSALQAFPCPSPACRGFVSGSRCGTCKQETCQKCREILAQSHVCDPNNLETMATLEKESKACPKCSVRIMRSAGCDHMFCTHCRTHFHWVTGDILKNSSNHHYLNTAEFAQTTQCTVLQPFPANAVPFHLRSHALFPLLFREADGAKYLRDAIFGAEKNARAHDEALIQIRLSFLRQKITEDQAKSKLYMEDMGHQKKTLMREILDLFLQTLYSLQRKFVNGNLEEIPGILERLLDFCRSSSADLKKEFGGTVAGFSSNIFSGAPLVSLA
jgi:hypothetical protein